MAKYRREHIIYRGKKQHLISENTTVANIDAGIRYEYNFNMPMPKKQRSQCLSCGLETARNGYKYCSNQCQSDFAYAQYVQKWLKGEIIGLQKQGIVSRHVKRYLREKFNNQCCQCGWNSINVYTGVVPLVADHIDGNWQNNQESNLRLICPNCDALSATYAALNKGKGRKNRVKSNRSFQATKLLNKDSGASDIIISVLPK